MRRSGLRPSLLVSLIAITLLVGACLNPIMDPPLSYVLRFHGNGSTAGDLGAEASYELEPAFAVVQVGTSVVVPGRGTLESGTQGFRGWSTRPGGGAAVYRPGAVVPMPAHDVTLYAVWTSEPTFSVAYSTNSATSGSAPVDSIGHFPGEAVTVLPNSGGLVRTGYTFGGWNTTSAGDGDDRPPGTTFTMPAANVLLHAKWIPEGSTFTVTFDSQGADTPASPTSIDVVPPATTVGSLPTAPTLAGQFFGGWWTEPGGGGTEFTATTTVAGNITVYASWSAVPPYTVTFESNGGSIVSAQTVPEGGLVTEPADPVRAGNIFNGWYADAGLTTLWNFAVDTVTANITIYAGWTPINYLVSYDGFGGTGAMGTQSVTYNGSVTLNANLFTRVGHRFMGWSETPGGMVDWNDGASYNHTIETNRTLYAVWEQEYTVTYTALDADLGGTPPVDPNSPYLVDDLVTVLGNPGALARTDHTFGGWTNGTDTYVAGNDFPMPSGNVTLNPVWVPDGMYTVTYDGNGHNIDAPPVDANTYTAGANVLVAGRGTMELQQDGISFRFVEWNTAPDGSGSPHPESSILPMPASDITLYAVWDVIGGIGPAGGLVFHDHGSVRPDGWRYLEMSQTEWNSIQWGPNSLVGSPTGSGIGDGRLNTMLVAAWLDSLSLVDRAAQVTRDLVEGGTFDDWFLPSTDELLEVHSVLHLEGLGGLNPSIYWTSTELNAFNAATVNMSTGTSGNSDKTFVSPRYARAVRAFRSDQPTRIVVYHPNGASAGTVPVDPYHYEPGQGATIAENTGGLDKAGETFVGWNTEADGSGTIYAELGSHLFTAGESNLILHAQWSVFAGGDGTLGNPYLIATAEHVNQIRNYTDQNFLQIADIDLGVPPWDAGAGWEPIPAFSGVYNGDNFELQNVFIDRNDPSVGLFASATAAVFQNVRLTNANVTNAGGDTGVLVGRVTGAGATLFSRVLVQGVLTGGSGGTGGVVGYAVNLDVEESGAIVSVDGGGRTGGLIGHAFGTGTIQTSFAAGSVLSASGFWPVGGLVGHTEAGIILRDSYTTGSVTAPAADSVGGFGGQVDGDVTRSFAAGPVSSGGAGVGGFIGVDNGTVTSSFYDEHTAGLVAGTGTPLPTAAMLDPDTFTGAGWDFSAVWDITPGATYPYLQWHAGLHPPTEPTGVFSVLDIGPAGGWVFYDKGLYSDGWRYLEAAPVDSPPVTWSNIEDVLLGGTSPAIGAGPANTMLIVSQAGHTSSAAQDAIDASFGGRTDWFLPSIDELVAMNTVLQPQETYNFATGFPNYWSSTESTATSISARNIGHQLTQGLVKTNILRSRATRRF